MIGAALADMWNEHKAEIIALLIVLAGAIVFVSLCQYASGKISQAQLKADFKAGGVAPNMGKDLIEVVSIPEVKALLSQIKAA